MPPRPFGSTNCRVSPTASAGCILTVLPGGSSHACVPAASILPSNSILGVYGTGTPWLTKTCVAMSDTLLSPATGPTVTVFPRFTQKVTVEVSTMLLDPRQVAPDTRLHKYNTAGAHAEEGETSLVFKWFFKCTGKVYTEVWSQKQMLSPYITMRLSSSAVWSMEIAERGESSALTLIAFRVSGAMSVSFNWDINPLRSEFSSSSSDTFACREEI